jgi:cardiolipin synthase (CMP-forming)
MRHEVSSRIVTIPNILSLVRLALIPVFLVLLLEGQDVAALATLVLSSVTDYLDGLLARRLGQVSRLGQLLDPAADRLFIFATLIGLAVTGIVPWWLLAVVAGRDVVLLALGVVLANVGYGPIPVHNLGKIATFCLLLALPVFMVAEAFPETAEIATPLGWAFALWGAFLYWWAGGVYLVEARRILRASGDDHPRESDTLENQGRNTMVDSEGKDPHRVDAPGGPETTSHFTAEFEAQLAALGGVVSTEEQEAISALPSGSALLVVRRGPNVGARFLLDSDVTTAGRHPNADIFLDDVTVSRKHSEFLRHGTVFEIKDLGSLNGTYFDGVRIETAVLTDGAEVQIGKFRLTFYASRVDLANLASK